jgi:hypothetical protein
MLATIQFKISHTKGRTYIEGFWERGADENNLDLRGRKWQECGKDCIMRSFINCTRHIILLGSSNQR